MDGVVSDTPENLWYQFGEQSGIANKERFMEYYQGTDDGYAYKIDQAYRLENALDPRDCVEGFVPPTSFHYMSGELLWRLQEQVAPHFHSVNTPPLAQYSSD